MAPRKGKNQNKMNPVSPLSNRQEGLTFMNLHPKSSFSSRYLNSFSSFQMNPGQPEAKHEDDLLSVIESKVMEERIPSGLRRFKLINGESADVNTVSRSFPKNLVCSNFRFNKNLTYPSLNHRIFVVHRGVELKLSSLHSRLYR